MISVEPTQCIDCGQWWVWYCWELGVYCDDEELQIEHECNPR